MSKLITRVRGERVVTTVDRTPETLEEWGTPQASVGNYEGDADIMLPFIMTYAIVDAAVGEAIGADLIISEGSKGLSLATLQYIAKRV